MSKYFPILVLCVFGVVAGCVRDGDDSASAPNNDYVARLDAGVPALLAEHKAAGAGVGIINDGVLVWEGYYGEQGPGIEASAQTVFNTASVAKTVASETLIALAAKGVISLDEPIHSYVDHADLSTDPRYKLLTTKLLLSHRGGLLNWAYSYDDGRAAFVSEPGAAYSYSGMGIELAAQYAENKLGKDFEQLAFEHLLSPIGVEEMSLGRVKPWMAERLAKPMNNEGDYVELSEFSNRLAPDSSGEWSGADDLLATIQSYSKFLIGVMQSDWLSIEQRAERLKILSDLKGDQIWDCPEQEGLICPETYGHSLGWMVYKYADKTIVKHGGNDGGENALVYYSPETKDGAVIFVNGGNGIFVSTQIIGLLGDQPELAAYYRQLIEKFYGVTLPAPE